MEEPPCRQLTGRSAGTLHRIRSLAKSERLEDSRDRMARAVGSRWQLAARSETSYIVGAGAVFKVQMLSQGFKGRAK